MIEGSPRTPAEGTPAEGTPAEGTPAEGTPAAGAPAAGAPAEGNSKEGGWFCFAMGDFQADFPRDRYYATNHMWAQAVGTGRWRLGLTAYAVRLLQDVYFLDWIVEPPAAVALRAQIGSIESKKAESDLFSPLAGRLAEINHVVLDDPSLINADPYGEGWLIEIAAEDDAPLLTPDRYAEHLVDAWEVAQRTIKGQANTD